MKIIYIIVALVVLALAGVALIAAPTFETNNSAETDTNTLIAEDDLSLEDDSDAIDEEEAAVDPRPEPLSQSTIGQSVNGTPIVAYHYGTGDRELLLVGGIHGGYSWNTSALAYEVMEYLESNIAALGNIRVTVIPALNPDGLEAVFGTATNIDFSGAPAVADTVPGRFNANNVDLNRNFDCEWQPEATWQSRTVSGGDAPFSEPESQAVRDYVANNPIAGAVVWYSAVGGVYSSNCRNGVFAATADMTDVYATAASYPAFAEYDYYEITGDMVNWLASENIPGISVLLTEHQTTERTQNIAGVTALVNYLQSN